MKRKGFNWYDYINSSSKMLALIILLIATLLALGTIAGCRQPYTVAEATQQDSTKNAVVTHDSDKDVSKVQKDSVLEKVYVYVNGDTVREYRNKYVYRVSHDTVKVVKKDSVYLYVNKYITKTNTVTKTVNHIPWYCWGGICLLAALCIYLLWDRLKKFMISCADFI